MLQTPQPFTSQRTRAAAFQFYIVGWLEMNTSTAHPSLHAATTLQGLLPPHLWRVLARNGITTIEQVAQSYPEKLLQMPSVGPRTFRKIEESLFPGKRYAPPQQPNIAQADLDQAPRALPFFRRTQNALRRHDLK